MRQRAAAAARHFGNKEYIIIKIVTMAIIAVSVPPAEKEFPASA
jgi:hypothetical protein